MKFLKQLAILFKTIFIHHLTFAAMVIAVNTRMLSGDEATATFLLELFAVITASNPSHQFIFITEKDALAVPAYSNVKTVSIPQQSSSQLMWKIWYHYKLPSVLRKNKVSVLLSPDCICSLRTKIPQCLLVNDLAFYHHQQWHNKQYSSFINANIAACLQKGVAVITFSETVKKEIEDMYKTAGIKISVALPGANKSFTPLPADEQDAVKEKYTEGKEYFLFYGAIHPRSELINLLKAFSVFKKRQKSNMQLLIAASTVPEKNEFIESLRLYKFRNDLQLISVADEAALHALTAAAYGCINLSPLHADIYFLQNAQQCRVPVIAADTLQAKEMLGEAALYSHLSFEAIAAQLMLLYKDENKRNELLQKGIDHAAAFTLENTAKIFWQNMLAAAGK